MVKIGFGGSQTALHHKGAVENNGTMIFGDHINFGGGSQICTVNAKSQLNVGDHTSIMGDTHIVAKKQISIGTDCIISWDTQLMDTDLHDICINDSVINPDKPILINDHVWLGSKTTILKGSTIASGCIVAASSTISGVINDENTVVTGMPIKAIKNGCEWRHTDIFSVDNTE